MRVYVVAASQKEAAQLAEFGWESRAGAEAHLRECREPPTDHFYGNKLSIYTVEWRKDEKTEVLPDWPSLEALRSTGDMSPLRSDAEKLAPGPTIEVFCAYCGKHEENPSTHVCEEEEL